MKLKMKLWLWMLCTCFNSHLSAQYVNRLEDSLSTIMFKVTSPLHNNTSYLFGTHHAFGRAFVDEHPEVISALKSSNLLIKENLNIPGHLAEDIINARQTTTKWSSYLNKKDLQFVREMFAESPTDYHKLTPTELYVFLNRFFKAKVCLAKDAADESMTLDDYLGTKAKAFGLQLMGLETTEFQIALINKDVDGMPKKVHKRRLSNIIDHISSSNKSNCNETDWYLNMSFNYQFDKPCTNSLVLTDRNNDWMNVISKQLQTHNCFIAVGLSHLMFNCGLIKKLQLMGYEVTPVDMK